MLICTLIDRTKNFDVKMTEGLLVLCFVLLALDSHGCYDAYMFIQF